MRYMNASWPVQVYLEVVAIVQTYDIRPIVHHLAIKPRDISHQVYWIVAPGKSDRGANSAMRAMMASSNSLGVPPATRMFVWDSA